MVLFQFQIIMSKIHKKNLYFIFKLLIIVPFTLAIIFSHPVSSKLLTVMSSWIWMPEKWNLAHP